MRCLEKNKQTIYYSLYSGITPNIDDDGFRTGTYSETYSSPVSALFNVSAARGESEIEKFGSDLAYSKTMVTCDMDCPITETSHLWVDITPSNNTPFNYVVVRVARSINSITYAIKEVSSTNEIQS